MCVLLLDIYALNIYMMYTTCLPSVTRFSRLPCFFSYNSGCAEKMVLLTLCYRAMHSFYLYIWRSLRAPFPPYFCFSKFLPSLNLNERKNRSNSRVIMNALKCIERTFWLLLLGLWLVLVKNCERNTGHYLTGDYLVVFWNFYHVETASFWSSLTYNGKGLIVFFFSFFLEFVSVITMSRFLFVNLYEMKFCGEIGGVLLSVTHLLSRFWICAVNGTRSTLFVDLWKCSRGGGKSARIRASY